MSCNRYLSGAAPRPGVDRPCSEQPPPRRSSPPAILSGTTVLVTVKGEVDATNSRALAGYVERQIAGSTRLVLDLAGDRFLRHRRVRGPAQRQRDLRPIRGSWVLVVGPTGATLPSRSAIPTMCCRSTRHSAVDHAGRRPARSRAPRWWGPPARSSATVGRDSARGPGRARVEVLVELDAQRRHTGSASRRTAASFSPTPAVKVMTSALPSSAMYAPMYLRSRWMYTS